MPSLHMLGHMIAVGVIAALVKQIVERKNEVLKLQTELDELRNHARCLTDDKIDNFSNQESSGIEEEPNTGKDKLFSSKAVEENGKSIDKNTTHSSTDSESFKEVQVDNSDKDTLNSVQSSLWCHEGNNQLCEANNICYNSDVDEFVLFLDEFSLMENVDVIDGAITVDLSSVKEHNNRQLTIATLPSSVSEQFSVNWVRDTTFLFQRFLPDNVMHMFHDDVIPLHHTLRLIQHRSETSYAKFSKFDISLFLYEEKDDTDADRYYQLFSRHKLKFKQDFQEPRKLTCFHKMFIGLSKTTVWYDYGFNKPQGPVSPMQAQGQHIRRTADYIRQYSVENSEKVLSSNYVILFSRKENRKILNAAELTLSLVKHGDIKVVNLDIDSYSLNEVIFYVSNSRGVIGMHGSLMILSMFLKPSSFVIELFPYAVSPDNYTPYKTLCSLKGMNIHYYPWTNQKPENSVGHPDWPAEVGGLLHLGQEEREAIMEQTEVPPHLCCSDPSWLYHIYQDTMIDCENILKIIKKFKKEVKQELNANIASAYFLNFMPSKVQNVTCAKKCDIQNNDVNDCQLNIIWNVPWTLTYLKISVLKYDILIQEQSIDGESKVTTWTSSTNSAFFTLKSSKESVYLWVRGVIESGIQGPFSNAVLCSLVDT